MTSPSDNPGAAAPSVPVDPAGQNASRRLFLAFHHDDVAALRALLDEGMDPYTAHPVAALDLLSMAIGQRHGARTLRKMLLSPALKLDPTRMGSRASPDAPYVHTPWHIAARWRDTSAIKAMVKLCALNGQAPNVNTPDRDGETPLSLALLHPLGVRAPKFDTVHPAVQALIDAGADVNVRCKNGRPLYQEMLARHTHLFKDQRAPMSQPLMLNAFIPAGLDPNLTDAKGNTLMHQMASVHPGYLDRLIEAGGRLFERNAAGKTVLDCVEPAVQQRLHAAAVREEARLLDAELDEAGPPIEPATTGRRRL